MKKYCFAFISLAAWIFLFTRVASSSPKQPLVQGRFEVAEHKNLVYRPLVKGEIFSIWNRLDLYLPKGGKDFPVLVVVHGGAWVSGDKVLEFIPEIAHIFARQGIGVAAVNYRLYPFFPHPAQIEDVARAVAWIRQNISNYCGRADQLFLLGHSAGGHLVSLLATDESHLKREGLTLKDICGVVSLSGVYRLTEMTVQVKNSLIQKDFTWTANPFTPVFGKDPRACLEASPLTHVKPGLPPFLVLYAEDELPVLPEMAADFADALRENLCAVRLIQMPRRNHCTLMWNLRYPDDPVGVLVRRFIRKNLD